MNLTLTKSTFWQSLSKNREVQVALALWMLLAGASVIIAQSFTVS